LREPPLLSQTIATKQGTLSETFAADEQSAILGNEADPANLTGSDYASITPSRTYLPVIF
jgi:hypothetical protein